MLIDNRTTFLNGGSVVGATGRRAIGDAIDLTNVRDLGGDANVYFVLLVTTTFVGAGATIVFELVTDAQDPPLVDGSATEHLTSQSFPVASCVAGTQLMCQVLPLEVTAGIYERYMSVIINASTTALSAGAVTAFLTLQPPNLKQYPDGRR